MAVHAVGFGFVTNTVGKFVAASMGGGHQFAQRLLELFLPAAAVVASALALG